MNKFVGRLLICLLACFSSTLASQASEDAPLQNGAFVFRGRLIGVHFQRDNANDTVCLTLQFLTEDPIADFAIRSPGTSIQDVATNIKLDPSTLTAANYRESIEASIGHDVRLGDSCLVVANWPGMRGKELITIEPATPEAEARLRAEHHESIGYFRRQDNKREPQALGMRLGTYVTQVIDLISQLETNRSAPAEYRSGLKDAIKHYVDGFRTDYAAQKTALATRMNTLKTAIDSAGDAAEEKRILNLMLDDLEAIDAKNEQARIQMRQQLHEFGLESLMPDDQASQ